MRLTAFIVATIVMICCRFVHADADSPTVSQRQTAHYDLYVENIDADAIGELLETQYAELTKFFGRSPPGGERLQVRIYSTHDRYIAARKPEDRLRRLAEDKRVRVELEAWGTYDHENKTAWCTLSVEPWGSRHTILHECVHQFHALACCGNVSPNSRYYVEGLAEHFSMHQWNGHSVVLGAMPMIAGRDDPERALTDLREHPSRGPLELATSVEPPSLKDEGKGYGAAWGLVSFLIDQRPEQFRRWAAALDSHADPTAAWKNAFAGEVDADLTKEYGAWLLKHQQPWHIVSGFWENTDQHTFNAMGPVPRGLAVSVFKGPVASLRASVELAGDSPVGGVVVGCTTDHDYILLMVPPSGIPRLEVMKDGNWIAVIPIQTTQVDDPNKFSIELAKSGTAVAIAIDGQAVTSFEVADESRIGLAASNGGATFSDVEVK